MNVHEFQAKQLFGQFGVPVPRGREITSPEAGAAWAAELNTPVFVVSNYDNLEVKPHAFTEGDTLNKMSDADLTAIISHGGPALSKSPWMPPYGYTLSKSDIQALIAYIRMVSDPPYQASGTVYAQK